MASGTIGALFRCEKLLKDLEDLVGPGPEDTDV